MRFPFLLMLLRRFPSLVLVAVMVMSMAFHVTFFLESLGPVFVDLLPTIGEVLFRMGIFMAMLGPIIVGEMVLLLEIPVSFFLGLLGTVCV